MPSSPNVEHKRGKNVMNNSSEEQLLDNKTTFIYALSDPVTHLIRYVGKANNPQQRLYMHLREKSGTHKDRWLKKLQSQGVYDNPKVTV